MSDDALDLKVEMAKVSDLVPYARNARKHMPHQVSQIAKSIERFGFTNPILVDHDNNVISGHGRLLAAQQLKRKHVPVIRVSHLDKLGQIGLGLADNRIAESAEWNFELLKSKLLDLEGQDYELDVLGFSAKTLEGLLVVDDGEDHEPIPFDRDESQSGADHILLSFGSKKIYLNPEESDLLTEVYYAHKEANGGVATGFVAKMCEVFTC